MLDVLLLLLLLDEEDDDKEYTVAGDCVNATVVLTSFSLPLEHLELPSVAPGEGAPASCSSSSSSFSLPRRLAAWESLIASSSAFFVFFFLLFLLFYLHVLN